MRSGVRRVIWSFTPPVVTAGVRRLRRARARFVPRLRAWEYVPEGWTRHADPKVKGWNVEGVLEAYKAKLPVFRRAVEGSGPIAIPTSVATLRTGPSVLDQNSILIYGYALALAARHKDKVSIFDWGGGLGFFYPLSRALLPAEVEIEYHCKEVSGLCAYGRTAVPGARFYDDDSCLGRRYDLVLASGSLEYNENWSDVLGRLADATAGHLLVTRVPVVREARSFVVLQRAYRFGHDTEYLAWVLNQGELVDVAAGSDMELVREFLIGYRGRVYGAPEEIQSRGFLFRRAHPSATSPA